MIFLLVTLVLVFVFVQNIWQRNPLNIQNKSTWKTNNFANLQSSSLFSFWLALLYVYYPVCIGPLVVIQAPTIVDLLMVGKLSLRSIIDPLDTKSINWGKTSEISKPWIVLLHVTWRWPRCITGLSGAANQTSARAIAALHIRVSWPVPVSLATPCHIL